jgi:hypothetical protein
VIENVAPESSRVYEQLARDIGPERLDRIYEMLEEFITLLETSKVDYAAAKAVPATRVTRKSS